MPTLMNPSGPANGGPAALDVLLPSADPDPAAALAIAFCARGTSVRLHRLPAPGGRPHATVDPSGRARQDAEWIVTDGEGRSIRESLQVRDAVLHGRPTVEVQLRDASGAVLATGRVATRRSVALTADQMLRVAGPLIVMAACRAGRPPRSDSDRSPSAPSRVSSVTADLAGLARFAGRLARAAVTRREWSVARFPSGTTIDTLVRSAAPPGAWLKLQTARGLRFWADPCVVVDDGRESLLVEEFDARSGRGVIRLLHVGPSGTVVPGPVCLRTEHHLSFPQVYRTAEGWLATVETCSSRNPVYRFGRLGDPWEPADLPALPAGLADPVLTFDDTGAVGGVVATDAATDPNAVHVRYLLRDGGWQRDDAATFVDVTRARGGGTLDVARGLRAAQDCGGTYGRAVRVTRWDDVGADILTMDAVAMGRTADGRRPAGWHTLSWPADGDAVWCDAWRRKPTGLGAWWRLAERRHPRRCGG